MGRKENEYPASCILCNLSSVVDVSTTSFLIGADFSYSTMEGDTMDNELEQKVLQEETKLVEQQEPKLALFVEPIEPDRWYGTCYGRDLEREVGVHYQ